MRAVRERPILLSLADVVGGFAEVGNDSTFSPPSLSPYLSLSPLPSLVFLSIRAASLLRMKFGSYACRFASDHNYVRVVPVRSLYE